MGESGSGQVTKAPSTVSDARGGHTMNDLWCLESQLWLAVMSDFWKIGLASLILQGMPRLSQQPLALLPGQQSLVLFAWPCAQAKRMKHD